jgi:hypothetical protein
MEMDMTLNFGLGGLTSSQGRYTADEWKLMSATRKIAASMVFFGIAGGVWIGLWAWGLAAPPQANSPLSLIAILGANMLVATAASAVGACFGFIFGIPRTLDRAVAAATAATQGVAAAVPQAAMATNTNLERISDWLTTLLIGATLVQIKEIAGWIGQLGKNLLRGGLAANDAIVPVIVILFFSAAFLGIYLITRLYLTSAFVSALGVLASGGPALTFGDLNYVLAAAVTAGTDAERYDALSKFAQFRFTQAERDDPVMNANIARLLAGLLKSASAGSAPTAGASLKEAISRAAKDSEVKAALLADFNSGVLQTGDSGLDQDVNKLLS